MVVLLPAILTHRISADYEQQRLHLLHKYGIDLESSHTLSPTDGTRTRRLDRKEVERLMGGGNGQEGIFTWREKNSRKVQSTSTSSMRPTSHLTFSYNNLHSLRTLCECTTTAVPS